MKKCILFFLLGGFLAVISGAWAVDRQPEFFEFSAMYGRTGQDRGEFLQPHGMAFSPDGKRLAVCDTGNHRVVLLELKSVPTDRVASEPAFEVEQTLGGIWPFEGSNVPIDRSDRDLEIDHADGVFPARDLKGREFHGGQGDVRDPENIPMDRFCRPECVAWIDEVTMVITDTENHRVKAQRITGDVLWILGREGWKNGYFHLPSGIAVDKDGNLFVTEPRSKYIRGLELNVFQKMSVQGNRMQIFGADLKPSKRFGNMHLMCGRFSNQFKDLTRVFIAADGSIFVTDTGNHRILILDGDLKVKKILREWPFYEMRYPYGVHGDGKGNIAIADTGNHSVLIVDKDGKLKQIIGKRGTPSTHAPSWRMPGVGASLPGTGMGEFSFPREARFGPDGALYVLDSMNSRIQIFRTPPSARASQSVLPDEPVAPASEIISLPASGAQPPEAFDSN